MKYAIVNKNDLQVLGFYEAETLTTDIPWWGNYILVASEYVHLEVGALDSDCVKAALVEDVITLVIDPDLMSAKTKDVKQALIAEMKVASDKDILDGMYALFGTMNENSATRQYLTWEKMVVKPSAYVGNLFADEAAVLAYATPKLAQCEAYSLFCIERTAKFNADKAAILN